MIPFDLGDAFRIAKIAFVVALFPAGFVAGCMDEKERFDAYRNLVAAVGEAQEARTKDRIASDLATKERIDREHKARIARLDLEHNAFVAELLASADSGIVPPVSAAPAGGGTGEGDRGVVCFARDRLSQGLSASLQRFADRYAEGVQRGASAIAGFETCASWALEEAAKPR